jgi:hypothetical protein
MRAGETDEYVSFKNEKLFMFIKQFVKDLKLRWVVDLNLFGIDN